MEVVRDKADNCIIICSIENIDPMGVHTGDSITVAPALTLTDKEYQIMRDASIAVLREIGVETGGSNVQFAVNPDDGRLVVIEMNPRVSRSSALASKATGFPIAKVAAQARRRLHARRARQRHHRRRDAGLASSRPSTTSSPRSRASPSRSSPAPSRSLTTAMKSVGEVDGDRPHLPGIAAEGAARPRDRPHRPRRDRDPRPRRGRRQERHPAPRSARRRPTACSWSPQAHAPRHLARGGPRGLQDRPVVPRADRRRSSTSRRKVREHGLPDDAGNLAHAEGAWASPTRASPRSPAQRGRGDVRELRDALDVRPVFKRIDTCAAEFASPTAYMYSTYETPFAGAARRRGAAVRPQEGRHPRRRSEPHRPGHRVRLLLLPCRLRAAATPATRPIMVNCNPETVSTDYDTSDRLYFEPLTAEDVLEILRAEQANGDAASASSCSSAARRR